MQDEVLTVMTADEARQCVTRISGHLNGARAEVLELYEREGWRALGYDSWRVCAEAEFGQGQAYLYRQLAAARMEREVSPIGEIGLIPESHLRELVKLDPNERYIVGQRVDLVKATAPEIRQVVERYKAEEVIGPGRAQAEAEYAEAKRLSDFLHRINSLRERMNALAAEEPIMDSDHPGPSLADAMFEWSEAIRAAASRVAVRYMDDRVEPRIRRIK